MTIKPILKRLHSPDALDLEAFSPADPTSFSLLLQAMFGPEGGAGEESFDILVCTPRWLATEVESKGVLNGRHHLVVSKFDVEQIRSYLVAYRRQQIITAKKYCSIVWKMARTQRRGRVITWVLTD